MLGVVIGTALGAAFAPVLVGPALGAVGFGAIGPIARSIAATVQSAGAVGAAFSTLQSAAMGGYGKRWRDPPDQLDGRLDRVPGRVLQPRPASFAVGGWTKALAKELPRAWNVQLLHRRDGRRQQDQLRNHLAQTHCPVATRPYAADLGLPHQRAADLHAQRAGPGRLVRSCRTWPPPCTTL
ncbi:hypothetical protein PG996_009336 [Apiospora saccharicola]|uniref:Uncharacterized protein n=1 Tax=Apiospora saccharicola TaxID=335842 RepID=A0ABR1UMW7_9PEZI